MSVAMQPMALDLALPWQPDPEQEKKFKRLLKRLLIPLLLLFLIIPWLPQIEPEFEELQVDIAVTQVLLQPIVEPEPEPVVAEKPKPIVPPKPKPEIKPAPKEIVLKKEPEPAVIKTTPKPSPVETTAPESQVKTEEPKEEVSVRSSQGLDKLSNQLSAVRSSLDLSKLQNKNLSNDKIGTAARASRDRLGSANVSRQSGGVGIDGELMNNESTDLSSHTTVAVAGLTVGEGSVSGDQSYLASRQGLRDMESIRRTLEGEKSSIYNLYQQVLTDSPDVAGRFIFKLWIEPDGSISKITLLSSELKKDELEDNLLKRIKQVNFGPEDVSQTPVEYTYVFLPS